jgi:hypothetical protein
MIPYIGNSYYCYADSTAMLLAANGENVSDSRIEVLCGVALGAMWIPESNMIFFGNLAAPPDIGISQALDLLGFRFTEKSSETAAPPPFEALRADLAQSPAVLGPLDMGFLRYNPEHPHLNGADHYVLAYRMDDCEIYLHDPIGFPHVALTLEDLEHAWKAERIAYRRGSYRYWTALQRCARPTEEELYIRAIQTFKATYQTSERIAAQEPWAKGWAIDREAILKCAGHVRSGNIAPNLKAHLTHFALQLGAKRAFDFALFFEPRSSVLANLKHRQAELFGKSHTLAAREDWASLADALQGLADIEEQFRATLFAR